MQKILLTILLVLTACAPLAAPAQTAPATPPIPSAAPAELPQVIKIHATGATQTWLQTAFQCADEQKVTLETVNDPQQADISLRLGEPDQLNTPAFKIGLEDLLVVANRESPVQNLTLEGVQSLFSHPETQGVQIWVYAPGEDVQQVFAREVLGGQTVTSLARLAVSPQQMSDSLNQDKNAVGILPRHWKAGGVREVFTLPGVPVLAIVKSDPQGPIKTLLACLQK